MFDLLAKLTAFVLEKFGSNRRDFVIAGLTVLSLSIVFVYFFGGQAVEPGIDSLFANKISAYFDGRLKTEKGYINPPSIPLSKLDPDLGKRLAKVEVDLDSMRSPTAKSGDAKPQGEIAALQARLAKIETDFGAKLEKMKTSLYDDIDAVYTISHTFTELDITGSKDAPLKQVKPIIFSHYIFADLAKHSVKLVINRRLNSFGLDVCYNGNQGKAFCDERTSNFGEDITSKLKKYPLKGTTAGAEMDSDIAKFPDHIHLIQIRPNRFNWDGGDTVSIDGYIIVKRAAENN
jgi:hypothetical protein